MSVFSPNVKYKGLSHFVILRIPGTSTPGTAYLTVSLFCWSSGRNAQGKVEGPVREGSLVSSDSSLRVRN